MRAATVFCSQLWVNMYLGIAIGVLPGIHTNFGQQSEVTSDGYSRSRIDRPAVEIFLIAVVQTNRQVLVRGSYATPDNPFFSKIFLNKPGIHFLLTTVES